MKTHKITLILIITCTFGFGQSECDTTIDYGNNPASGKYALVNGIKMYYETYGNSTKQPLLIIHGNGGSIKSGRCQIEYFKNDYYVIVADSRFQGKSENGKEKLTYKLMTEDYNSFLNYLKLDSLYIIGQSDGGIIGLQLVIKYPSKVKKLVAIAPNLRSDNSAVHQWDIDNVTKDLEEAELKLKQGDNSKETIRNRELLNLIDKFPNIKTEELLKIKSPVLVIAGDEDVIKLEHILEIYQNIPKAQLFIMPGATHFMIRSEHKLLNQMANRFLSNPFKRPTTKEILSKNK
ncbi:MULTISPECIES: alpha/beta fold hydrolase [Aequorivita]|uniref:Alpha/beta hydrolase n=2 Tax=Aequorivita TaxID=153265 RepID=A0AB35YPN8_9FLAO|nr:alpha/beta hydrolase [Aequorivita sp. Ant34-E75]WGF91674.1 alpha/beta hydrolase [Aequorivita sp. Ant34-E75]